MITFRIVAVFVIVVDAVVVVAVVIAVVASIVACCWLLLMLLLLLLLLLMHPTHQTAATVANFDCMMGRSIDTNCTDCNKLDISYCCYAPFVPTIAIVHKPGAPPPQLFLCNT